MDIINRIFIKLFAKKAGEDEFGNQYYQNKENKRFVIYNGIVEPSKVPMHWHAWLHHYSNEIPHEVEKHSWQKIHIPNLTGTKNSYSPNNSCEKKTSQNYQAWKPNS
jgi:NADH dehydrogenase